MTNMKVRAEDYRIGNYAYGKTCSGELVIQRVCVVREDGFVKGQTWRIESPIPLSEDILLKAGFSKHPLADCYGIEVCDGVMMDIDLIGNIEIGDDFKRYSEYWYLHQLQNLVKALTGEELKIEL